MATKRASATATAPKRDPTRERAEVLADFLQEHGFRTESAVRARASVWFAALHDKGRATTGVVLVELSDNDPHIVVKPAIERWEVDVKMAERVRDVLRRSPLKEWLA
jgi:hypothetical protein